MGTLLLVILDAMAGIAVGWLFLVATLAGLGYPLLFSGRRESAGPAVIRGTAYGFLCWIVAELTLPPQWGDRALGWSRQASAAGVDRLPAYLLLGAGIGLAFSWWGAGPVAVRR